MSEMHAWWVMSNERGNGIECVMWVYMCDVVVPDTNESSAVPSSTPARHTNTYIDVMDHTRWAY